MKNGNLVKGTVAAIASGLIFCAGVVVGENMPPEKPRGITVSDTVALDLGQQLNSVEGHQQRLRVVSFEPGAAVPLHNHLGRPGIVYVLQGTVTEHLEGKGDFERRQGEIFTEDTSTVHWVENRTNLPAKLLVSDIYKP